MVSQRKTLFSETKHWFVPPSFQFPTASIETSNIAHLGVQVPDVFNESRIKSDLQVLAGQPTLLAQYIAQAKLRVTQARQIAVLQRWTEIYKVGEDVIIARTKLIGAHHDILQVSREGEIKVRKKTFGYEILEAQLEEAALREAQARHARENLGKAPAQPEAPLSAEEQRILRKRAIERVSLVYEMKRARR